ncbi:MAG TPA: UrcA family protein [Phenylobacterium sp.]|jgi:UrcA family protein|nr:UrcA family protein [Phenylobacterium sp.]
MRHLVFATLAAAAALCVGAPALAQATDEVTVTGHTPYAESLSRTVSYADLDLNRQADRDQLVMRIQETAGSLCDQLNQEPSSFHNMGVSCQDVAVRDAMSQVNQVFADAGATAAGMASGTGQAEAGQNDAGRDN